jgi:Spy/CpxP family protein refolding chaperone
MQDSKRWTRAGVMLAAIVLLGSPARAASTATSTTQAKSTHVAPATAPVPTVAATPANAATPASAPTPAVRPEPPTPADEAVWFSDTGHGAPPRDEDEDGLAMLDDFDEMMLGGFDEGGQSGFQDGPTPLVPMLAGFDGPPGAPGAEMGDGMEGGGMGPGSGARMEALKLTEEQKNKLADLRDRQRREGIQARADLQIASLDLGKLMREEKPDRAKINAQIDKIETRRATMRKSQVGTMLEMRDVLTPEQRATLKQQREERRHDRGGRGHTWGREDGGPGTSH